MPYGDRAVGDAHPLSDATWSAFKSLMPIACVDVLPVVRDSNGHVSQVGLIRRNGPPEVGVVWCHVGGRVHHSESLRAAALRHVAATLTGAGGAAIGDEPYFTNEYFPDRRPSAGYDPTKHAVASCFTAEFKQPQPLSVVPDGEGSEFRWFAVRDVPSELWPGSLAMIDRAVALKEWEHDEAVYASVSDRQISRDELMWQTPALAMTAMAFLLTIALGSPGASTWARALAAALSAGVSVMSIQLMARHSVFSILDAQMLEAIESVHSMRPAHARFLGRLETAVADRSWISRGLHQVSRYRSRDVWLLGLLAFLAASVYAFVAVVSGH